MKIRQFSKRHAAARRLAMAGCPVIPCEVGGKLPVGHLVPHGINDETTDLAKIDEWWSQADWNYAFRPHNLPTPCTVIDLDLYKGVDQAILALIPPTRTVRSPSGGEHRYYDDPEGRGNGKLAPTVDIRSRNGYVLGPGSAINGVEYEIIDIRPPAPLPAAIVAALSPRKEKSGEGRVLPDELEEVDASEWLTAEAERIIAGVDLAGAEATGDRAWRLTNLLLDLRSPDAQVLSLPGVAALLPWVAPATIENACKHGEDQRGKRLPFPEPPAAIPAEWAASLPRPKRWRLPSEDADLPPIVYFDAQKTFPRIPGGAVVVATAPQSQHKTGLVIKKCLDAVEQGYRVLYIAPDGGYSVRRYRLPAARELRDMSWEHLNAHWHTWEDDSWNLFTGARKLVDVCEENDFKPDIIVMDVATLAAPGEFNSPEYGTTLHAHCAALAKHFDAMIILVNHPKKDGGESLGSTLIDQLANTIWHISATDYAVRCWVQKLKDGKAQFAVTYGIDRSVREIPVIVDTVTTKAGAPSSLRATALDLIAEMSDECPVDRLMPAFEARGFSRKTVMRALDDDLADMAKRHGDGTLWEPATFMPPPEA